MTDTETLIARPIPILKLKVVKTRNDETRNVGIIETETYSRVSLCL